jgi:transcription initiation factor TFIIH subunit 2
VKRAAQGRFEEGRKRTNSLSTLSLPFCARADANITLTSVSTEPEIFALRNLATQSGGSFSTVLSAQHLKQLLAALVPPPPTAEHRTTSLHRTAFPTLLRTPHPHLASAGPSRTSFVTSSFECPVCKTCNVSCPGQCATCGVRLARSVDLVRCARNLRPAPAYAEVPSEEGGACAGCGERERRGRGRSVLKCGGCGSRFCFQCDAYVHEDLRACPGCVGRT